MIPCKQALITYGQPRTFFADTADKLDKAGFYYARCINHGDIVPKVSDEL